MEQPKLEKLEFMLAWLPPVIARRSVEKFLGGLISGKTIANDEQKPGGGPRKFIRGPGNCISYPTAWLLEYLERKGIEVIDVAE